MVARVTGRSKENKDLNFGDECIADPDGNQSVKATEASHVMEGQISRTIMLSQHLEDLTFDSKK